MPVPLQGTRVTRDTAGRQGNRVPRVTRGPHGAIASVHISEVKEKDHDVPEQELYDAPDCQMLLM